MPDVKNNARFRDLFLGISSHIFYFPEKTLDKAMPRLEKDNLRENDFIKVKSTHPRNRFDALLISGILRHTCHTISIVRPRV